ncbi:hypothetical protein CC80DRAFT_507680 [Byssothecium circinans]|uniref:RING-type domain-containing protein n=1 Tax=Byssothecium circinans TaxID=147558 RepID=A0A6A5TQ65_9PLEO|nr:hypothetical protein CC80DRAFT_507680 [Byssothecium circinans]
MSTSKPYIVTQEIIDAHITLDILRSSEHLKPLEVFAEDPNNALECPICYKPFRAPKNPSTDRKDITGDCDTSTQKEETGAETGEEDDRRPYRLSKEICGDVPHLSHRSCFIMWFQEHKKNTCPTCRAKVYVREWDYIRDRLLLRIKDLGKKLEEYTLARR